MHIDEKQLENFIQHSGLINKKEWQEIKKLSQEQGKSVGRLAVSRDHITDDDLRRIEAHILGVPFVDLKNRKLDFETLSIIPEPVSRNHNIVSFKKNSHILEVAMLDIEDLKEIDFLRKKGNYKILPRLTDSESLKWALLLYQKTLKSEFGDVIQEEVASLKEGKREKLTEAELRKLAESKPFVSIVDALFKHALLQGTTDIHLEPGEDELLVRYRIDGSLREAMFLPPLATRGIISRLKLLSHLKLEDNPLPQEGRFRIESEDESVSVRVATWPIVHGEKLVVHLLRESTSGFTLEGLGFEGEALEEMHRALNYRSGLILVSGPVGSGKTTSLYTFLDILNAPGVNISTIEEDIEYHLPRVNQAKVRPEIGFTFSNGLRTLLKQDPDIVMVGDVKDSETAGLVVNTALTGRLVLAGLHSNTAVGAIFRLLDLQVEPFTLSSNLNLVVAQRLVKRLSSKKVKYFLNKEELRSLGLVVSLDKILALLKKEKVISAKTTWSEVPFYKPDPDSTFDESYSGRISLQEVLKITPTIKDLINGSASASEIEAQAKEEGMHTLLEDGLIKAVQGFTSLEEVLNTVGR